MRCVLLLARLAAFAVACTLGVSASAQSPADKYPEKPIRIIVPYPPGGSVDVLGRVLAQRMQENWGQTVIVENRPGAGTMIGTAAVAKADPDGYTLLVAVSAHTTNPAFHTAMQYDSIKDFAPVALLARTPVVLYSHPSLPATTVKELAALGAAKTHTLNFGSAGTGSMTHLTGELLKIKADIDMLHIVYRG
jgi:tripartite-type tricarboxylate transporter receptor subunit TctC